MWGSWSSGAGAQTPEGPDRAGGRSPELSILHFHPELLPLVRVHAVPLRGAGGRGRCQALAGLTGGLRPRGPSSLSPSQKASVWSSPMSQFQRLSQEGQLQGCSA